MIFKLLDAEIHQYSLQRRNNARHSFHFLCVMMRPWTQHHWWINSTPKIGDAANHLSHGPPIHGNPATKALISIRRSRRKCYQTQRWNGRCTRKTRKKDDKRKKSDEREMAHVRMKIPQVAFKPQMAMDESLLIRLPLWEWKEDPVQSRARRSNRRDCR